MEPSLVLRVLENDMREVLCFAVIECRIDSGMVRVARHVDILVVDVNKSCNNHSPP